MGNISTCYCSNDISEADTIYDTKKDNIEMIDDNIQLYVTKNICSNNDSNNTNNVFQ
jgi:hypothetical protein